MQKSSDVLAQLDAFRASRRKPQDIQTETEAKLGLPTAQQRLTGLRGAITNTENLLRNVDSSVTGRTSGTFTTEAQRQRLVAKERAPLSDEFREQSRALEGEQANISDLRQQVGQQTGFAIGEQDKQEGTLKSLYDTLFGREQAETSQREREQARVQEQQRFDIQQRLAEEQRRQEQQRYEEAQRLAEAQRIEEQRRYEQEWQEKLRQSRLQSEQMSAQTRNLLERINQSNRTPIPQYTPPTPAPSQPVGPTEDQKAYNAYLAQEDPARKGLFGIRDFFPELTERNWVNAINEAGDSWSKTFRNNGALALLGKGTFW